MRNPGLFALLGLLACNTNKDKVVETADPFAQEGVTLVKSDKARDTSPDCSAAEVQAVVDGDAALAFDLYHQLGAASQDNLFFSPHSISVALAMMWAGALGDTESQMADTLHYTLEQDRFHPAMNGVQLMLDDRAEIVSDDADPFTLDVVNALWGQTGVSFESPWLDILAVDYGAGIYTLDIAGDPEGARDTINAAVAEATDDKIEELLPPGSIDPATALVLTNAILFKAGWTTPFEPEATTSDPFTLDGGEEVSVPTMHGEIEAYYAVGDGYEAVEVSYSGGPYAMMIIVPESGFSAFEGTLDAESFTSIRHGMSHGTVDLSLPRWDSGSAFSLVPALSALGMIDPFDSSADFTGINTSLGLYISDVIHQAVISVDEEGTEAAAATAIISDSGAIGDPDEPVEIKVDRPFIYAILEHESGTVLFLGREMNPS